MNKKTFWFYYRNISISIVQSMQNKKHRSWPKKPLFYNKTHYTLITIMLMFIHTADDKNAIQ